MIGARGHSLKPEARSEVGRFTLTALIAFDALGLWTCSRGTKRPTSLALQACWGFSDMSGRFTCDRGDEFPFVWHSGRRHFLGTGRLLPLTTHRPPSSPHCAGPSRWRSPRMVVAIRGQPAQRVHFCDLISPPCERKRIYGGATACRPGHDSDDAGLVAVDEEAAS